MIFSPSFSDSIFAPMETNEDNGFDLVRDFQNRGQPCVARPPPSVLWQRFAWPWLFFASFRPPCVARLLSCRGVSGFWRRSRVSRGIFWTVTQTCRQKGQDNADIFLFFAQSKRGRVREVNPSPHIGCQPWKDNVCLIFLKIVAGRFVPNRTSVTLRPTSGFSISISVIHLSSRFE